MRLVTRTFLSVFLPVAGLLLGSFWALRSRVETEVREDLRASVRQNQDLLEQERSRDLLQVDRVLNILAVNSDLRAAMERRSANPNDPEALAALMVEVTQVAKFFRFDLLLVSTNDGKALAAVRSGLRGLEPLHVEGIPPETGFYSSEGRIYEVSTGQITNGQGENRQGAVKFGRITIGEQFDLSRFSTPTVLLHQGKTIAAAKGLPDLGTIDLALQQCSDPAECEVQAEGKAYLSLAMGKRFGGYELRSLQAVDTASAPMNAVLTRVFLSASLAVVGAALAISALSSRAMTRPLASVLAQLKSSEGTGILPDFTTTDTRIEEIRELADGFNRAAMAVREGREELVHAYVAFTGSLAQALDARDPYTAGHSRRVSDYACAIATSLGVSGQPLEDLRIGALLHDIGKIGISDSILLKTGRLTPAEEELIREHPAIGRKILEGVHGFHAYLDVVELHHENWDGSGYPHGLQADQTPLAARIVKVADAYDAMTSDRPYRRGMTHESAVGVLEKASGSHFEARIVEALKSIELFREIGNAGSSLANLGRIVGAGPTKEVRVL